MPKKVIAILLSLSLLLALGLLSGCGKQAAKETSSEATNGTATMKSNKINLGHTGAICEAPFFMAYEKGFFKEEGLDVTLIQGDGNFRKEGVATGKLDATDTVLMGFLMSWVEGMDINISAGIHTGCMAVVVPVNSPIKTLADLKGKVVGCTGMGSGAHMFAMGAIMENGLTEKDVTWKAYANPELLIALQKGEVEAAATGDTMAYMWIRDGKARMLSSQALDEPYGSETCCHLAVNGERQRNDPEAIRRLTRAVVRGAEWVDKNRAEAVKIMLDKRYNQGDQELNLTIINTYKYQTDAVTGKEAIRQAVKRYKMGKILPADYDGEALINKVYVDMSGTTPKV